MSSEPIFSSLSPLSLPDRVAQELKDALFSGKLKPGEAIVERKIAQQMNVGTPVVREALITLQAQGFVRRIANTATRVTQFTDEEVRHLYQLRVELETVALQWAKQRITPSDIEELESLVDKLVESGIERDPRMFLERDMAFHSRYWELSGNPFLADTLKRLMAPLFVFAFFGTGKALTAPMAREHYVIVDALRELEEPAFTDTVRNMLSCFADRWVSAIRGRRLTAEGNGSSAAHED
jgi:GntR family transcriptional regulator of gluconate operon